MQSNIDSRLSLQVGGTDENSENKMMVLLSLQQNFKLL